MDAYVVLHFKGVRATVIGAGADEASAHEIADRYVAGPWSKWNRQEHLGREIRSSGTTNEDQTITRVPLAGYSEIAFQLSPETQRLMEQDRARAAAVRRYGDMVIGLEIQQQPEPPSWTDMMELISRISATHGTPNDKIRCGNGEAWDWLRRGLDKLTVYPSDRTLPDSSVAQLLGYDVVLDPALPPNMIRFGDKMFSIKGDSVIEIDLKQLRDLSRPLIAGPWDGSTDPAKDMQDYLRSSPGARLARLGFDIDNDRPATNRPG